MQNIIFWGATGQAKILHECISYLDFKLVALFDNNSNLCSPFEGVPIIAGNKFCNWLAQQDSIGSLYFLVAIGGNHGKDRLEIQAQLESYGLKPFRVIHPTAFVAKNVKIGLGSQILAHSSVCVDSIIGKASIINTAASVDHECIIGDGVHVGPGATVAGLVEIKSCAMIGAGATILPRITIGEGATVGAGAVVTKDVLDYTVVVGNPAKRKKTVLNKKYGANQRVEANKNE
jgi:sugar O-acyltransferase (sialic acid O-acetyltransferase NeuD family)